MRSMFCSVLISAKVAETSSNSGSESNNARNPTKRSGSLSTTAIRIIGFLATAAFIVFPVRIGPWLENRHICQRCKEQSLKRDYGSNMQNGDSYRPFGMKLASFTVNKA